MGCLLCIGFSIYFGYLARAHWPVPMGKGQKQKKGQTLSLAEFASDAVAADPMALPTAPREAAECVQAKKKNVTYKKTSKRESAKFQQNHCSI